MNLVFMTFYLGVFLSLHSCFAVHCPPLFLLPFSSCGCFGRLCWLYCSSARLFRLYFCVVVVSVALVGCTVLPHASPFIILRRGCFGRLCWLNCPSTRFSHWCLCCGCFGRLCWLYCPSTPFFVFSVFRALWSFRSPLLVVLFFRTLLPYCTAFSPFSLSPPFVS